MANLGITAASVIGVAGRQLQSGTAGVAIVQGDVVYVDTADSNKLKLAIATSAAASVFGGIAVNSGAVGQPVQYQTAGTITIGGTLALGIIYCISATAGKLCPSADLIAGNFVTIIGMPTTTAILNIVPFTSGIAKA